MTWLKDVIGTEKAIIAMCHLMALPGDPYYDKEKGMDFVIEMAIKDLNSLQDGGVDALMFSNEFSMPYLTDVRVETVAAMARIIGEIKHYIKIPFGVNVLWDAKKSLDLAIATDAQFVREIFSGVYASDFGLWNTNAGESVRHQHQIGAEKIRLIYNIVPEASGYIANREVSEIAKSTVFNCRPDAICVSGSIAGAETKIETLKAVKDVLPDTVVLSNTGVNLKNYANNLAVADGAIVGTTFKYDGVFINHVDKIRVKEFMDKVKDYRAS
jgi:membrane complex biogenesis BtpA family protein